MAHNSITIHIGREAPEPRASIDLERFLAVHCSKCLGCNDWIYPKGNICPSCPTDAEAREHHGQPFAYSVDDFSPQSVHEARQDGVEAPGKAHWTHHDLDGDTHRAHLDTDGNVVLEDWG